MEALPRLSGPRVHRFGERVKGSCYDVGGIVGALPRTSPQAVIPYVAIDERKSVRSPPSKTKNTSSPVTKMVLSPNEASNAHSGCAAP